MMFPAERPDNGRTSVVVTSISGPNTVLRTIAEGCLSRNWPFWVIGDVSSPSDFHLEGSHFLSVQEQLQTDFRFASACPTKHYARKNIGYLLAIAGGADVLIETDDDNYPHTDFWSARSLKQRCPNLRDAGWVNVYRCFTDSRVWPRGFPLDRVNASPLPLDTSRETESLCPIQQGLADENPDVDAVYRLLFPLPLNFRKAPAVAVSRGAWCPFNSQNTTWFRRAFPLLYLPAYCSFRATDIWRGMIAQRICWENEWSVLFHQATVHQDRNEHDLMKDFADEVPVYLQSRRIADTLEAISLQPGEEAIPTNLLRCYESLVGIGVFGKEEIPLLDSWLTDLRKARALRPAATAGAARH